MAELMIRARDALPIGAMQAIATYIAGNSLLSQVKPTQRAARIELEMRRK
jgi:hypothetical protein